MSHLYNILKTFFLSFYGSMKDAIKISGIEQYVIDFVIKLRDKHNLNQEDIATILNVKRTFITNVESARNRAKYNLSHIDKLADHFGLSPRDFLPQKSTIN
jgi:transcriptional regulator with XRE-family HTH domain